MTYEITYELHNVYQTLLIRADSAERARDYLAGRKPSAQIIGVSVATADSYKPGIPVLVAGHQ